MFNDFQKILIIAPHADDCEIGCGGTIAKLVSEGKDVLCGVFCTVPKVLPNSELNQTSWYQEQIKASEILGTKVYFFQKAIYEMRMLPSYRQIILEDLVLLRKRFEPDVVIIPSTFDLHQDHQTVCHESIRAFKKYSILGYEMDWNQIGLHQSQLYVELSEENIQKKKEAIAIFESQTWRTFCDPEIVEANARCAGLHIGSKYAEKYEVIRWISR